MSSPQISDTDMIVDQDRYGVLFGSTSLVSNIVKKICGWNANHWISPHYAVI